MLIQNIFSWGVAAMLSSLFLGTGSVDRNATSSQNGLTASVKEMKEAKGCATGFGKRTDLMFKYKLDDYDQHLVEDLDNWEYLGEVGDVDPQCNANAEERACVISVSPTDVIGISPNFELDPNIVLTTQAKPLSSTVYHITGANIINFNFYNEKDQ